MKIFNLSLIILLLIGGLSSCEYLDIVPDERPTEEDAFKDLTAAKKYLYSCYSYMPLARYGSGSLDLMTGDEVITAFEHETFAKFPKGNYTATTPVISYWDDLFSGIRQCYLLLANIESVPGMSQEQLNDYKGQAEFLIAYYHFLLMRCYGPTIVIDEVPDVGTNPADFAARRPFDECVEFAVGKFDAAAELLPESRHSLAYGLATSTAAKALKARLLLMAASPLFNGNSSMYADFKNNDGTPLMPTTYDPSKWQKAKEAAQDAITFAESYGHALYVNNEYGLNGYPQDPTVRTLRYNLIEPANPDVIWADSRNEGYYGVQNKSRPYVSSASWNGIGPTFSMLDRFYTENGLPIDEDPDYDYNNRFDVVTVASEDELMASPGEQTLAYNLNREPRYYAWVSFQGGYYEVMSAETEGAYRDDPKFTQVAEGADIKARLVTSFLKEDNCGRGNRTNNYAPSGFLNKKACNPDNTAKLGRSQPVETPWPLIRLTELYLTMAEACVEVNDLPNAIKYVDLVRQHAGIPKVEDAWAGVATLDQDKLREIVRRERQIELYLENHNFWDMRRWLLAGDAFNKKHKGLDIDANDIFTYAVETEIPFVRSFRDANYLLPIPIKDINNNTNLVQNPGY